MSLTLRFAGFTGEFLSAFALLAIRADAEYTMAVIANLEPMLLGDLILQLLDGIAVEFDHGAAFGAD